MRRLPVVGGSSRTLLERHHAHALDGYRCRRSGEVGADPIPMVEPPTASSAPAPVVNSRMRGPRYRKNNASPWLPPFVRQEQAVSGLRQPSERETSGSVPAFTMVPTSMVTPIAPMTTGCCGCVSHNRARPLRRRKRTADPPAMRPGTFVWQAPAGQDQERCRHHGEYQLEAPRSTISPAAAAPGCSPGSCQTEATVRPAELLRPPKEPVTALLGWPVERRQRVHNADCEEHRDGQGKKRRHSSTERQPRR